MGYYEGQRENPCPRCGGVVATLFVSVSPMSFSQRCLGCGTTEFTEDEERLLGDNVLPTVPAEPPGDDPMTEAEHVHDWALSVPGDTRTCWCGTTRTPSPDTARGAGMKTREQLEAALLKGLTTIANDEGEPMRIAVMSPDGGVSFGQEAGLAALLADQVLAASPAPDPGAGVPTLAEILDLLERGKPFEARAWLRAALAPSAEPPETT